MTSALGIVPDMQVSFKTVFLSAVIMPIDDTLIWPEIPQDVDIFHGRNTKIVSIKNLNYLVSIQIKSMPSAFQFQL